MRITIVHGSILDADAQVIVNAANSLGLMGGGVAGVIKRDAGAEVERTARREFNNEQTPQLLGSPEILSKGVRLLERGNP